jgi:hypothetical protein
MRPYAKANAGCRFLEYLDSSYLLPTPILIFILDSAILTLLTASLFSPFQPLDGRFKNIDGSQTIVSPEMKAVTAVFI